MNINIISVRPDDSSAFNVTEVKSGLEQVEEEEDHLAFIVL